MPVIASTAYANLASAVRGIGAKWNIPGLAVGVMNGNTYEYTASGVLNIETGVPVSPGSLFQIGSITKVFTATAVMRLVEAGKVTLDEPITTYLPELTLKDPELASKLTLRLMLNHMSGILGDHFPDHGRGDDALKEAIDHLDDIVAITPINFALSYCNLGFMIAGRVVEVITGKTFEQALADEVFAPLKLDPITLFPDEAILHSTGVGHINSDGKLSVARPYPISRCSNAAGGIVTSTENLLKFAKFHIGDGTVDGEQVLSLDSITEMQQVFANVHPGFDWGLGWMLGDVEGVKTIGHGGSTNGQQAQLTIVPDKSYAIAILTNGNQGGAAAKELVEWAIEHDLGLKNPQPTVVALSDDEIAPLLGVYRAPLTESTFRQGEKGLELSIVSFNPFSGEASPPRVVGLEGLGPNTLQISEGALQGSRIDFIDTDAGTTGAPAYVRLGLRLAARQ